MDEHAPAPLMREYTVHPAPLPSSQMFSDATSHWFWQILLPMEKWLHLHYMPHGILYFAS